MCTYSVNCSLRPTVENTIELQEDHSVYDDSGLLRGVRRGGTAISYINTFVEIQQLSVQFSPNSRVNSKREWSLGTGMPNQMFEYLIEFVIIPACLIPSYSNIRYKSRVKSMQYDCTLEYSIYLNSRVVWEGPCGSWCNVLLTRICFYMLTARRCMNGRVNGCSLVL